MTATKRREWPPWWEWELKFTDYTYKRMKERDCTEIEVRRMLEHATNHYPSKEEGRFVIENRFRQSRGKSWWNKTRRRSDWTL